MIRCHDAPQTCKSGLQERIDRMINKAFLRCCMPRTLIPRFAVDFEGFHSSLCFVRNDELRDE